MARYFKVVEIDRDSFIGATGEDLDCCQLSTVCDGIGYVAVDDTEEDEITVSLDIFEEDEFVVVKESLEEIYDKIRK